MGESSVGTAPAGWRSALLLGASLVSGVTAGLFTLWGVVMGVATWSAPCQPGDTCGTDPTRALAAAVVVALVTPLSLLAAWRTAPWPLPRRLCLLAVPLVGVVVGGAWAVP